MAVPALPSLCPFHLHSQARSRTRPLCQEKILAHENHSTVEWFLKHRSPQMEYVTATTNLLRFPPVFNSESSLPCVFSFPAGHKWFIIFSVIQFLFVLLFVFHELVLHSTENAIYLGEGYDMLIPEADILIWRHPPPSFVISYPRGTPSQWRFLSTTAR